MADPSPFANLDEAQLHYLKSQYLASLQLVGRPCGRAFTVLATGTRGSRATLRLAIVPCIPPPID